MDTREAVDDIQLLEETLLSHQELLEQTIVSIIRVMSLGCDPLLTYYQTLAEDLSTQISVLTEIRDQLLLVVESNLKFH